MFANLKKKIESEVGDLSRLAAPALRSITSQSDRLTPLGSRRTSISSLTSDSTPGKLTTPSNSNNKDGQLLFPVSPSPGGDNNSSKEALLKMKRQFEEKMQSLELDFAWRLSSKDEEIGKLRKQVDHLGGRLQERECETQAKLVRVQEDMDSLEGFSKQENAKIKHLLLNREEELSVLRAKEMEKDNTIRELREQLSNSGGGGGGRQEEQEELKREQEELKATLESKIQSLTSENSQLQSNYADLQERFSVLEETSSATVCRVTEELKRTESELRGRLGGVMGRCGKLEGDVASRSQEIEKLEGRLAEEGARRGVEREKIAEEYKKMVEVAVREERERVTIEYKKSMELAVAAERERVTKEVTAEKERVVREVEGRLQEEREKVIKQMEERVKERDGVIERLQQSNQEVPQDHALSEKNTQIDKLQSEVASLQETLQSKEVDHDQAIERFQRTVQSRDSDLTTATQEKETLEKELSNLRDELTAASTSLSKLREELSSKETSTAREKEDLVNTVKKELLEQFEAEKSHLLKQFQSEKVTLLEEKESALLEKFHADKMERDQLLKEQYDADRSDLLKKFEAEKSSLLEQQESLVTKIRTQLHQQSQTDKLEAIKEIELKLQEQFEAEKAMIIESTESRLLEQFASEKSTLLEKLSSETAALQERLHQLESEKSSSLQHLLSKISDLESTNTTLQQSLLDSSETAALQSKIAELQVECQFLKESSSAQEKESFETIADLRSKLEELSTFEADCSDMVLQISEIQSKCDQLEEENRFLKGDDLKKRVSELEGEVQERGQALKQQSLQLQDLRRSLAKEINRNNNNQQSTSNQSLSESPAPSRMEHQQQCNGTQQPPPAATLPPQETDVNFMYLRSVLFKYLTTTDVQVTQQLTRVVATLLHLNEEESHLLSQAAESHRHGFFQMSKS